MPDDRARVHVTRSRNPAEVVPWAPWCPWCNRFISQRRTWQDAYNDAVAHCCAGVQLTQTRLRIARVADRLAVKAGPPQYVRSNHARSAYAEAAALIRRAAGAA